MKRLAFLILVAAGSAAAQESTSFKLEEHSLNGGGRPSAGSVPTSAQFQITLSSIGEAVAMTGVTSSSFRADVSFVSSYAPPGEVAGLQLAASKQDLAWDAERSRGSYSLYRGSLTDLSALGYGICLQQDLATESAIDSDAPAPGAGFFYLVTVINRLGEEGTKGTQSDGTTEREGTTCP